jgi:hypothetical protein
MPPGIQNDKHGLKHSRINGQGPKEQLENSIEDLIGEVQRFLVQFAGHYDLLRHRNEEIVQ